jgi:hypothetical protein
MKKIATATLFMICFCAFAYPQEIVFSQDVKSDTVRPTKGPNLKNYKHLYVNATFPVFTNEELNYTVPGATMIVDYGIRYKRRLSNTFAVGYDLSLNWASYRIKNGDDKSIPDSAKHDKEKFKVNSLTPALYLRINAGRRGNKIGNYLDLGGYGSWNWKKAYKTIDELDNDEVKRVTFSKLHYMESFSYGVLARVGVNRYAITARYRLSNLFKDTVDYAELPRLSLGVEIGLLK